MSQTPVRVDLFTCPAVTVHGCAPVTPQAVIFLLGSNLDQVFLTRNGICDQEGALILDVVYLRAHTFTVTHITGSLFSFQRHKIRYTPGQNGRMTRQVCIWSDRWDHKNYRETSRMRGDSRWSSSRSPRPLPSWLTRLSVRQVLLREENGAVSKHMTDSGNVLDY